MSLADRSTAVLKSALELIHNRSSRWLPGVALVCLGLSGAGALHAQTAHFSYSQSSLGTGMYAPGGVAVDGSGNVYIADTGKIRVLKETLSGGSYTQSIIASGKDFTGVAVDGSGNVFVVDIYDGLVLKETPLGDGSYTESTFAANLDAPFAVTVDNSGNVYIGIWGDDNDNKSSLLKMTLSGGSYIPNTIVTGMDDPYGVAVDGSGNVYVSDNFNNRVLKETLSGGSYTQSTIGSDLVFPSGVAVDGNGNVYIGDQGHHQVVEVTPSGGQSILDRTGLSELNGVAVDGSGNIYIADQGNDRALKLQTAGVNFGTVNIGTPSTTVPLTFTFDTGGSGVSVAALTMGTAGLDFVDAGTGSCTTNGTSYVYAAGDTCTVDVVFTPKFAGTRNGAVQLLNSSGAVIATGYVYGNGNGPQIGFAPAARSYVVGGLDFTGVAVDGSGNVYIVNGQPEQNNVQKETLSGGNYILSTIIGTNSQWVSLNGVAVDGSGNVYIGASSSEFSGVLKETLSGGSYIQSQIGTGMVEPHGVAVDGSGNVYFSGTINNGVAKETLSGGSYTESQIISGLNDPEGLAVDGSGNIYIADSGSGSVLKETLSGGNYTPSQIASGLNSPRGVAVDGSGNVYIADTNNLRALKETLSGGSYIQSTIDGSLQYPYGLAVDGSGNVYIADSHGGHIVKEDYADAPSLTFASTSVDSTSSSQTVTVENNGTAALSFPIPTTGNNPAIAANFSLNSTGSTACPLLTTSASQSGSLAAGATCMLPISFAPEGVGSISGSLVLTDNNLNAGPPASSSYATQTIQLNGTATPATPAVTGLSPNSGLSIGGIAVTITGTNFTGAPSVHFGSALAASSTVVSATQIIATSPAGTAGTVDVTVTTANGTSAVSSADQFTYTAPVITITPTSLPAGTYGTAYSQTISGDRGTPPYSYTITAGALPSGLSLTTGGTLAGTPAAGSYSFTITAKDNDGYTGSQAYTLVIGKAVLMITAANVSKVYGAANPAFTGTVTGQQNGDTFAESFTTTAVITSAVGSYAITPSVAGANLANYTVNATNGTLTVGKAALTITAANASKVYGAANPTFTGTVAGQQNGDTFSESFATTATVASGVGSYAIVPSVTGANLANYTVSASNGTLTIGKATLTITAANASKVYGAANPTFTGTVTGALNGDTFSESFTTTATTTSAVGSYAIVPSVTGANLADYTVSASNGTLTIGDSTLTITAANATRVYGAANPAFTGTVIGQQNGDSFTESFATSATALSNVGKYAITPSVTGANLSDYTQTVDPGTLTVTQAGSTVVLSASSTSITPGQSVTLTAVVASVTSGTPTGSVSFYDGTVLLSSVSLTNGTAVLADATLAPAVTHAITAVYAGDTNFTGSASGTATGITVTPLDFTFSFTSQAQTVNPGVSGTFNFTLTSLYGAYPAAVTFTATGLPPGATATFSPATIAATASGAQTVVMTVQTSPSAANRRPGLGRTLAPVAFALLLLPLAGLRKGRRRMTRLLLGLLLLGGAMAGLSGCGSSGYFGPPVQSYNITVTASSGTIAHTATVTLTVE